jgi:DNA primase
MSEKAQLTVEGKKLAVSNLNKVLYPKAGFTKGQVIDYYIRVAPVLLPHLKDRPLTTKRYPNGIDRRGLTSMSHRSRGLHSRRGHSEIRKRISYSPKKNYA